MSEHWRVALKERHASALSVNGCIYCKTTDKKENDDTNNTRMTNCEDCKEQLKKVSALLKNIDYLEREGNDAMSLVKKYRDLVIWYSDLELIEDCDTICKRMLAKTNEVGVAMGIVRAFVLATKGWLAARHGGDLHQARRDAKEAVHSAACFLEMVSDLWAYQGKMELQSTLAAVLERTREGIKAKEGGSDEFRRCMMYSEEYFKNLQEEPDAENCTARMYSEACAYQRMAEVSIAPRCYLYFREAWYRAYLLDNKQRQRWLLNKMFQTTDDPWIAYLLNRALRHQTSNDSSTTQTEQSVSEYKKEMDLRVRRAAILEDTSDREAEFTRCLTFSEQFFVEKEQPNAFNSASRMEAESRAFEIMAELSSYPQCYKYSREAWYRASLLGDKERQTFLLSMVLKHTKDPHLSFILQCRIIRAIQRTAEAT